MLLKLFDRCGTFIPSFPKLSDRLIGRQTHSWCKGLPIWHYSHAQPGARDSSLLSMLHSESSGTRPPTKTQGLFLPSQKLAIYAYRPVV